MTNPTSQALETPVRNTGYLAPEEMTEAECDRVIMLIERNLRGHGLMPDERDAMVARRAACYARIRALALAALVPGVVVQLGYGNGSQAALVTEVGKRGGLKVIRLFGWGTKSRNGDAAHDFRVSSLKANDSRIERLLPATDARAACLMAYAAEKAVAL